MSTPRPVVAWFATLIEAALQRNDGKPHWGATDPADLYAGLVGEVAELALAMMTREPFTQVVEEAVDVAAFAMFLADKHGAAPTQDRGRA